MASRETRIVALRMAVESFQKYPHQAQPGYETDQIIERAERFVLYMVDELQSSGGEGNE